MVHVRQWGAVAAFGVAYALLRAWAMPEDPAVAVSNALEIVQLELKLDLFVEASLQGFVLGREWLVSALNTYYVALHLPPVLGLMVFAYVRRPDAWPLVRNVLLLFTALGLVVHIVYPVAPPWFVPELGIGDTFAKTHATSVQASTLGNPFAAMPSMHFGWALAVGIGFATLARSPGLRAFGVLHPIAMGVAIIATGNHYALDAVASVLLLAVSAGVAWWFTERSGRLLPGAPPTARQPDADQVEPPS